jgi:ergosteryl-3beta-O-L-aspartate synthase
LLMLLLQLGNIRLASLFPCDPKSFPSRPASLPLRHPEASTLLRATVKEGGDRSGKPQLPPLEDLIANYGDATATSWLDDRYRTWRDPATGAAVAYVPSGNYAIIPGDPLCDPRQFSPVVHQFLPWLHRETKLKPVWILISRPVEELLGDKFGWHGLSCIAESRVDPSRSTAAADGEVARKVRHAESEGVRIISIPQGKLVPADDNDDDDDDDDDDNNNVRARIDQRIRDWLAQRGDTQIRLSGVHPWRDHRHRWYFYAVDRDGQVCGFVVLAMLAPSHGMQIKYSFDFPGAPSGTIEYLVMHAIQTAAKSGVRSLTFGAAATAHVAPEHHLHGAKMRLLQHTYEVLTKQFHLARRGGFRVKMGAYEDPLYIAYPRHGLGSRGVRALLRFFED